MSKVYVVEEHFEIDSDKDDYTLFVDGSIKLFAVKEKAEEFISDYKNLEPILRRFDPCREIIKHDYNGDYIYTFKDDPWETNIYFSVKELEVIE